LFGKFYTIPANIQFFVWQVLHNSISTKEVLHHRRVCDLDVCPRCSTTAETISHCLFDCIEVSCIWIAFGLHNSRLNLTKEGLFDWRRKVNLSLGNISLLLCGWFGDRGMISFSTTSEQRCMRVLQKFNRCCHSALQLSIRRG
jgi:hypothetical protein